MEEKDYGSLEAVAYEHAHLKITTGDLLLCSGNHPLSQLVRNFSKPLFSHVAFVFTWNERVLVLESVEDNGVRAVPLNASVKASRHLKSPSYGGCHLGYVAV